MQFASQDKASDLTMSPSISTALIDSLFRDSGPMFAGAVCAGLAAIMTAVKSGNAWLLPCVALLVITGAVRAIGTRHYLHHVSSLTLQEAERWEIRYQI